MQEITSTELKLVAQLRKNVRDLYLERHHLETKNLLRFVRARDHSLENAEEMFRKQIEWRKEFHMDHIMEWKTPREYLNYWPAYYCGYDRADNVVIVVPFGIWDPAKVGEVTYSVFQRYTYRVIEGFWRMMQERSIGRKTMIQFTMIVDIAGLNWRTVTTYDAMHGIVDGARCFDVNYPETMNICYLLNNPYVFNVAWNLIKPMLSGRTFSKMTFLSGSDPTHWRAEISKVVDPSQFPQQYGGDLPDSIRIDPEKEVIRNSANVCNRPEVEPVRCCSKECLCE